MKDCPRCEGTGDVEIKVSTFGEDTSETHEIECVDCDGRGEITEQEAERNRRWENAWCECDEPSDRVTYIADGSGVSYNGIAVNKHHWTCDDCGLIRQMG